MRRNYPLIFGLFLLLLVLLVPACGEDPVTIEPNPAPDPDPVAISYLALGDSYTIGEGVAVEDRFPVQLAMTLRDSGYVVPEVEIIARTGWRTDNLADAIEDADLEATYELVSLLIGVNNQFQGRSLDDFRRDFTDLLQRAIELSGNRPERVFVVSIPDYAFTPYGQTRPNPDQISDEIDAFNAAKSEIAAALGVPFYNITPISRLGLAQPSLVASDRLHPSGRQYALWVASFVEEVTAILPDK